MERANRTGSKVSGNEPRPSTSRFNELLHEEKIIDRLERMLELVADPSRARSRSRSRSPPRHQEHESRVDPARIEQLEKTIKELSNRVLNSGNSRARSPANTRPEQEELVLMFDPARDEILVETWIRHVDDLAEKHGWDNRRIMKLIPGRLEGLARHLYGTLQREAYTWTELKEILVAHFSKKELFGKLFKEAINYELRPGQSCGNYCRQKLHKLRKLDMPDKYLIDIVIGGIPNETIAREIRAANLTDPDKLYELMRGIREIQANELSSVRPHIHASARRPRPPSVEHIKKERR